MEDSDRLTRLETHAEHSGVQLTQIKADVKDIKESVAALALNTEKSIAALALSTEKSIAALALSTETSIATTNSAIAALALSTEKSIAAFALRLERSTRRIQVGFLMMGAGLLAVIARAFHWL